jgi:hypothetical protein
MSKLLPLSSKLPPINVFTLNLSQVGININFAMFGGREQ